MHCAEKVHDTTPDNENNWEHNKGFVITLTRGHHIPANKRALALQTWVTLVTLLV